jgi:hypothetical protein
VISAITERRNPRFDALPPVQPGENQQTAKLFL